MGRMFNRDDKEMYSKLPRTPEDQALIMNLEFEHRVSPEREVEFQASLQGHGSFAAAAQDHYEKRIRYLEVPEFVSAELNAANLIEFGATPPSAFVNVLDLNGLMRVVELDQENGRHLRFPRYPGPSEDEQTRQAAYFQWLDENLTGRSEDEQKGFVSELLFVLAGFCAGKSPPHARDPGARSPYNPVWVTPFEQFKDHIGNFDDLERANRWQRLLGLAKEAGRWLVLLCYTLDEIKGDINGRLYRPTQLDAGKYDRHFPSHPAKEPHDGGQAMELCSEGEYNSPVALPEYIHVQVEHCLQKECIFAIGKTTASTFWKQEEMLSKCRHGHRARLAEEARDKDKKDWYPLERCWGNGIGGILA